MNSSMKAKQAQLGDLMKDFIDRTLALYGDMKDRPVSTPADTDALERISGGEIPAEGRPVETVYSELLRDVYASTALAQHPRSFACIPGPASLFSWMGDVMTSAYNPHASCKVNAPAAACVEKRLIRWMCGLAGYPEATAGGLFVSGGSIANLTALTAARDAKLTDTERAGAAVYISDQTHSSLAKALHIIGFRADQIRKIPSDADFRMDLAALRAQIEADISAGCRPFAVIASAGTTNTGSVDPLPEIAALCRERDMWMHVDGAFGASALLSERQREKLAGIELSDSLSWDAHKWMMQTYACSVVLVRDQACLVNSFAARSATRSTTPARWRSSRRKRSAACRIGKSSPARSSASSTSATCLKTARPRPSPTRSTATSRGKSPRAASHKSLRRKSTGGRYCASAR